MWDWVRIVGWSVVSALKSQRDLTQRMGWDAFLSGVAPQEPSASKVSATWKRALGLLSNATASFQITFTVGFRLPRSMSLMKVRCKSAL